MPRAFDSDDVESGEAQLHFTQILECPVCFSELIGHFYDTTGSMTAEDMAEPPIGIHTCPDCHHRWGSVYEGWQFYSEAG